MTFNKVSLSYITIAGLGSSVLACGGSDDDVPASAKAAVVVDSGVVDLSGTTWDDRNELGGEVLEYRILGMKCDNYRKQAGYLQNSVVKEDDGTIAIYVRMIMEGASAYGLDIGEWRTPGPIDVDYRLDGMGEVPALPGPHAPGEVSAKWVTT